MTPIEIRLADRQATLAGIVRALHAQLVHVAVSRVELHYSGHSPTPLPLAQVRQKIAQLLREHGQPLAQVSVHRHAGPIDDATGEHLLRLLPASVRHDGAARLPASSGRLARGLGRLRQALGLPARAARPGQAAATVGRQEPGIGGPPGDPAQPGGASALPAPPAVPAVGTAQAVRLLTQAVTQGASFVEGAQQPEDLGMGIAQAVVTVRVEPLHRVLQALVQQDPAAIGRMVQRNGLALAPGFSVHYRFRPQAEGDGTRLANESDLDVRLQLPGAEETMADTAPAVTRPAPRPDARPTEAAAKAAAAAMATDCSALPAARAQPPNPSAIPAAAADVTAMPARRAPSVAAPQAVARVLGTTQGLFAQPFELALGPLPTQLDRRTLQRAGFGLLHPQLLAVASNRCPLRLRLADDGQAVLEPGLRPALAGPSGQAAPPGRPGTGAATGAREGADPGQADTPMYYDVTTHDPLRHPRPLRQGRGLVLVNHPDGALLPDGQQRLPALMVEVEVTGLAAPHTMAA